MYRFTAALVALQGTHTHTHTHTRGGTPTDDESVRRRNNTQHAQETNIHVPGGVQTHNPSKRTAADRAVTGIGEVQPRVLTETILRVT